MREKFKDYNFRGSTEVYLNNILSILREYEKQGYVLTLRQLFYQLVSRDIIPNKVQEYAKLSVVCTNARMAGLLDWSALEDRVRRPNRPYWVKDVKDALDDTIGAYRLDRTLGQPNYIEVWIEKDALSSIFLRVTQPYHYILNGKSRV
jgi:hypothetical protein